MVDIKKRKNRLAKKEVERGIKCHLNTCKMKRNVNAEKSTVNIPWAGLSVAAEMRNRVEDVILQTEKEFVGQCGGKANSAAILRSESLTR